MHLKYDATAKINKGPVLRAHIQAESSFQSDVAKVAAQQERYRNHPSMYVPLGKERLRDCL